LAHKIIFLLSLASERNELLSLFRQKEKEFLKKGQHVRNQKSIIYDPDWCCMSTSSLTLKLPHTSLIYEGGNEACLLSWWSLSNYQFNF
jgi:hypothetical protein